MDEIMNDERLNKSSKKITRAAVIAACAGIILLLFFSAFLFAEANRVKEKQNSQLTQDYAHFQSDIQNFFSNKISLMTGFSAYVQTFQEYNDAEINSFLANLTRGNEEYIRDVGIIQDSTIQWIYPVEGNEKAIGVDLSKVPDQAASIEYVKTTLQYHFDGPKQLVQGGTGYIIRVPILKNGSYWGIVSIVLNAEKVQELFTEYANDHHLKFAIINKSSGKNLIFGDRSIIKQNHLSFESNFSGNEWKIYVTSSEQSLTEWKYFLLLSISGILVILLISHYIYRFFRDAERVREKNDMLNRVAFWDRLTGIHNRSFFDIRLHEEISLSNRYATPLSIIYFDLDHFKKVNDSFGHGHGDAVLRKISEALHAHLRSCDVFARWGGEEFAILMPSTTLLGAVTAAEKIRTVIETIQHPFIGKVTASFGVAEYFPDEYAGSWFKRVDQALYHAKKEGRNRVKASEPRTADESVQYQIRWLEEWNSGNHSLDEEHKKILHIANQLVEDSYTINTLEESISRYNELLDHLTDHISKEESLLDTFHYSELDEHKKSHEYLMSKAILFRDEVNSNKLNPQQLFNLLVSEIIVGHLAKEDVKYFPLFGRK
jgi:diguanylate cyclase (GGDEF)-like protein/hemerythrin-like metal-binding protein